MTFLAIAFLFFAVFLLWQRMQESDRRLHELEYLVQDSLRQRAADMVEPLSAPEPELEQADPQERQPVQDRAQEAPLQDTAPEPSLEMALASMPDAEPAFQADIETPEDADAAPITERFAFNFEDIFGRLLPIWAGGITLAVAGFFLVRYSIELGLLTPFVRVLLSFLFGISLLGAAEVAFRWEEKIRDPRVRQALAGAGLATLYASFLLAGRFYGMIGTATAFIGLAGVTAGALALAGRFGLPTAILGLVGGFAAPMLVGGEEANMPVLTIYLALLTAGLNVVGARQRWAWLGIASLGFGLGWGGLLLLGGIAPGSDSAMFGLYLIAIGVALPYLADWKRPDRAISLVAAALASAQLALLVSSGGFSLLNWGLYMLLLGAISVLAWKDRSLLAGAIFAQGVAILLLLVWPNPDPRAFAAISAIILIISAVTPFLRLRRGEASMWSIAPVALMPVAISMIAAVQFELTLDAPSLIAGSAMAVLAILPTAALFFIRTGTAHEDQMRQLMLGGSAAFLVITASLVATPIWLTPVMVAGATLLLIAAYRYGWGVGLKPLIPAIALVAVIFLMIGGETASWERLFGWVQEHDLGKAIVRWGAVSVAAFAAAWALDNSIPYRWMQALGGITAYGALAQLLPLDALAASAGVAAIAATLAGRLSGARNAWVLITAIWGSAALIAWAFATLPSLSFTDWVNARHMIDYWDAIVMLAPLAIAGTFVAYRTTGTLRAQLLMVLSVIAGLALIHVLFKQLLFIESGAEFIANGYLERSLWEGLLLGAALIAYHYRERYVLLLVAARILASAALAHFVWYSVIGHNPLWDAQAVGATPIANLLLAGFAIGLGALLLMGKLLDEKRKDQRTALQALAMALITLLALSLLRQMFTGPILVGPSVGESEDLLRSLTAIMVAIGLLLWGARQNERSWRIGSLILMTLAVFKVFLHDAGDLEGLLRVGSFVALGFSLIGIGWFYSRQLRQAT